MERISLELRGTGQGLRYKHVIINRYIIPQKVGESPYGWLGGCAGGRQGRKEQRAVGRKVGRGSCPLPGKTPVNVTKPFQKKMKPSWPGC